MRLIIFGIVFGCFLNGYSQSEIGPKIQVYPAGIISTIQLTSFIGEQAAINLEVGYNLARRQDFGIHDNEEGGGFGFGLGYRRYLKEGEKGFYGEAAIESWFLDIDWKDMPVEGTSRIAVLQPTVGVGYQVRSKNENWAGTLGLAFGREWNVKTEGEEVGQGGISLLAFSLSCRL